MSWHMRRTDTGVVRVGGLLLFLFAFPGADTLENVLGEGIVLAVAVVIGVVLAFGDSDPRLDTAWQNAWR